LKKRSDKVAHIDFEERKIYIILKKIGSLLTPKEKLITISLLIMMLISSVLELLGIGLVLPVIALLAKPELIEQNKYLHAVYSFISPSSHNSFLIILCIMLIVLYILKNLFLVFQSYVQANFILNKGAALANKLFSNYIHAPYNYHLKHNSAYLLGNIGLAANVLSAGLLVPLMILFTEFFVVLAIFTMLLILSPLVSIGLILSTLFVAAITYYPLRNTNYNLGIILKDEQLELSKFALQGLKAIKESKVRNSEDFFTEEYSIHRKKYNKASAKSMFLKNLPRFIVESVAVILGFGALLILIVSGQSTGSIILTLSLFATSAIRLMPSMTRIQYNLAGIKHNLYSFNFIFNDLSDFSVEKKAVSDDPIKLNKSIDIDNLSFAYENTEKNIFTDFSLNINKNSSVAFVGPTGCGKTTMVDLILGLLKPQEGSISIDGININRNLVSWQKMIGYVPQFIFLLDDTVKSNVAFGEPDEHIDDKRVEECLKMAQVYDFIETLPDGINNLIGENGIRLSGGQRQRIGIARALYHNPEVLILDEATSALDHETETAFIDALNNLKGKLTIIMIAHRLTTVENCDEIITLAGCRGLGIATKD